MNHLLRGFASELIKLADTATGAPGAQGQIRPPKPITPGPATPSYSGSMGPSSGPLASIKQQEMWSPPKPQQPTWRPSPTYKPEASATPAPTPAGGKGHGRGGGGGGTSMPDPHMSFLQAAREYKSKGDLQQQAYTASPERKQQTQQPQTGIKPLEGGASGSAPHEDPLVKTKAQGQGVAATQPQRQFNARAAQGEFGGGNLNQSRFTPMTASERMRSGQVKSMASADNTANRHWGGRFMDSAGGGVDSSSKAEKKSPRDLGDRIVAGAERVTDKLPGSKSPNRWEKGFNSPPPMTMPARPQYVTAPSRPKSSPTTAQDLTQVSPTPGRGRVVTHGRAPTSFAPGEG